MSDNPSLKATIRTEFGKGAARRARRAGLVPAVVYGHGSEPFHVDVPSHELFMIVRANKNALVELKLEDGQQLALVKDIQRHPVNRDILHIDLLAVRAGEKVQVSVPLVVVGEPVPGTIHNVEEFSIPIKAPATEIPEAIEFDITGLEIGTIVRAADLVLPKDVEVELDPEADVLSIQEVPQEELPEPDTAAADAAAPADEGAATTAE